MGADPSGKLNLHGVESNNSSHSNAGDVPVFVCIVYVSPGAGGGVQARVANLLGLECNAASEREALAIIVPAFKQRVGELTRNQTLIPWIEPPTPAETGELKRFIPVHL